MTSQSPPAKKPQLDPVRRLGQRLGIGIFGAIVAVFTLHNAVLILMQVWPPAGKAESDCRAKTRSLIAAVRTAREAAAREIQGERAAVAQFRKRLEGAWKQRPGLEAGCRDDPVALRGLKQIDQFRYAEEHAARYEAVDLARRRRQMKSLEAQLGDDGRDAPHTTKK